MESPLHNKVNDRCWGGNENPQMEQLKAVLMLFWDNAFALVVQRFVITLYRDVGWNLLHCCWTIFNTIKNITDCEFRSPLMLIFNLENLCGAKFVALLVKNIIVVCSINICARDFRRYRDYDRVCCCSNLHMEICVEFIFMMSLCDFSVLLFPVECFPVELSR